MKRGVLGLLIVLTALVAVPYSAQAIGACGTVSTTDTLTANVTTAGTCITITGSNLDFNCNGNFITFNTGAGGDDSGIYVAARNNVTIRNCNIRSTNAGTLVRGVNVSLSTNVSVSNINVSLNNSNTGFGVWITGGHNVNVTSSYFQYSNSSGDAVELQNTTNVFVSGNNMNFTSPPGSTIGVAVTTRTNSTQIYNNNISSNGTGSQQSIALFDGVNFTIANNSVFNNGSSGEAVYLSAINNSRVENNTYTGGRTAIYVTSTSVNNVIANEIMSFSGTGALLGGDSAISSTNTNNSFSNISFYTATGTGIGNGGNTRNKTFNNITMTIINLSGGDAVSELGTSSNDYSNIIVNVSTTTSNRFGLRDVNGSRFTNIRLIGLREWVFLSSSGTSFNLTNASFETTFGSVRYPQSFTVSGAIRINQSNFNISNDRVFVNSTNVSVMNRSAEIFLVNSTYLSPAILSIDPADSGSFSRCSNGICNNIRVQGRNVTFNVTQFTSYSSNDSFPAFVNESSNLTSNITVNGSAIVINASNIVFDCNGFTIFYDAAGAGGVSAFQVSSRNNITIKNCVIFDANSSGSTAYGINLTTTTNSTLLNNTITTNGTTENNGIALSTSSNNNFIINNTINTFGTGNFNRGIYFILSSIRGNITGNTIRTFSGGFGSMGIRLETANHSYIEGNTIITDGSSTGNYGIEATVALNITALNNNISTNGTSQNYGIIFENVGCTSNRIDGNIVNTSGTSFSNFGITLNSTCQNSSVNNNQINTNGGGFAIGILVGNTGNNVTNNIVTTGGGSDNYGIQLITSAAQTIVENNNITTNGTTANHGIRVAGVQNNTLTNNRVIVGGTAGGFGVQLESSAVNNTFTNTRITNLLSYGINISNSSNTLTNTFISAQSWIFSEGTSQTNLTNIAFNTTNGTINVTSAVQINNNQDINQVNLNISYNRSFLNSTNLSNFNTTAQITLHNISVNSTAVDFNDDGTYEACNATQCQIESFNGSTIIFNVSSFTSYSAMNISAGNACPGTIVASTTLTSDVSDAGNCVTFGASDVFLDCNGYTMTWDTGGTGSDAVIATGRTNITVRNCIMNDGNSGGANGYGISFSGTTSSFITNNTIQTNGTDDNYGIRLVSSSDTNNIVNNTVRTLGSGTSNYAIEIDTSSSELFNNNTLLPSGAGSDHGVHLSNANNNNFTANNITPQANSVDGFNFANTCSGNRIENNYIASGPAGGNAIQTNNNPTNLVISTNRIEGVFRGILLQGNTQNATITNNNFTMTSASSISAIRINSPLATVTGNRIVTSTSNGFTGIIVQSGVTNSTVSDNNISLDVTNSAFGMDIDSTETTEFTNNRIDINSTSGSNFGIRTTGTTNNNNFAQNTIRVNGSSSSQGVRFTAFTQFNNLTGNTIISIGTAADNIGIEFNGAPTSNFVDNNTINTTGTIRNHGIRFFNGADNNTATRNTIHTEGGTNSFGILVDGTVNTYNNNNLLDDAAWIQSTTGAQGNFTNTTFQTNNGSIFIPGLFQLNDSKDITRNVLEVSSNSAYVNSTNMSTLNQSSQVILLNVPPTNPQPIVDFEDDGTFASCNATQCIIINSSNLTFIMNVSSFTNYSTQDTAACPGIITTDTNLTDNITTALTSQQSCVQFAANNIVLDCQGYTMTGNGSGLGINATSRSNITVQNCNVVKFNRNIYLTGTSNSKFMQTNVTNSTNINVFVDTSGSANNFSNLVVVHNATGSIDAMQFFIAGTNRVRNISMSLFGTGSGAGVYFFGSTDNSLDNMTSYSEGSSHSHAKITSTAPRNNVTNIVASNGTILEVSTASNNIRFINATGTNTTITLGTNNNVINNITANSNTGGTGFTLTGSGINVSNINILNSGGTGVSIGSSTTRLINATSNGTTGMSVTGSNNYFDSIVTNGTTGGGYTISSGAANNNITNMNATGTSGNGVLVSNFGSDNNRFINVVGTSASGAGIVFNTINNILINSTGMSSTGAGIVLFAGFGSSAHTVQNVTGTSDSLYGLELSGGSSSNISDSRFASNSNEAIRIGSSTNNNLNNNIIETNSTWIFNNAAGNNISNTTFRTVQGNINVTTNVTLGSETINVNKLNITSNRAFLNSTNLTFLNQSAQITLNNVNSSVLLVDFEDDGTYNLCNATQCQLVSFSGGTVIFNVSSFTSYSTGSFGGVNATLTKSDSPDPINLSSTTLLTYQINFTVTNGTAFNVTLNESYPANVTFVNSTPSTTSGNNFWNAGNLTTNKTYQINITVNVSDSLPNGSILTNTMTSMYENSTGSQFNFSVTELTDVINNVAVQTNATLTKTDSPDPLNISNSTLLTYQINFTVTQGTAYNVTINETYSGNVAFVNSTPSPTSGNNSWSAGNVSTAYQINITVNVSSSLANGTIVTNIVNATYNNVTGSSFVANATENTTILANVFTPTSISLTKSDAPDPVVAGQDLTYTINISVTNGTASNITLTDIYPSQVLFVSSTPSPNVSNNTWTVGNLTAGQTFQVNITVNVDNNAANNTLLNNTANISYANSTGNILTLNATAQTTVSTQSFPITINNNTNITTNGTTTGPGIIINASNVTVDCNNNIITGPGSNVGVNITGFNNVAIQNCVFVSFATGAHVENSNLTQFKNVTVRSVTDGVKFIGSAQNGAFNNTVIAASDEWIFASAGSTNNVFQNTSYNDSGGQIIIIPAVTVTPSNISQSLLDISSPDAFLNSTALPFLDVASRVTITGLSGVSQALILGDFDDDNVFQVCNAPFCSLISFGSGTAIFDTTGWTTYTTVDSGVNFTISKTSSPNPVTPGSQVVYTVTATVNSGFAQNITVVESSPAELTFVNSTPVNVSDDTWVLQNLSAGQSAQINITYNVSSNFTGTLANNITVTFQNSTNGTVTTNVSQNTTVQPSSSGGGSSGGGGGGANAAICPPFCQYPENKDLPVCRNNCPTGVQPSLPGFGSSFPPISETPVKEETPVVEEIVKEQIPEVPIKEDAAQSVKKKPFPWWYILIAIIAVVFMIWEAHHIVNKIHKPNKVDTKLDNIDKEIAKLRKQLRK